MESVGRIFLSARCRERTVLCSRCDRGQTYREGGCTARMWLMSEKSNEPLFISTGTGTDGQ